MNRTRFPVSRICQEHSRTWQETGMQNKYGHFTSTDNHKRFASLIFQKFPRMRESIAKQLKHSAQTERIIHDVSTGAENAVKVSQLMKNIDTLNKKKSLSPAKSPVRPSKIKLSIAGSWPEQAKHPKQESSYSDPGVATEIPINVANDNQTDMKAATWVATPDFSIKPTEDTGPSSSKVTSLEDKVSSHRSALLNENMGPTAHEIGLVRGMPKSDFTLEIQQAKLLKKKPKISELKRKLKDMPELANRWKSLMLLQQRDKIFSMKNMIK